ncbi:MAG: CoA pyrophosphatase [Acidimicrobiales bacterium]
MTDRGGPQRIPRPVGSQPGGPAPWAELDHPRVSLAGIAAALAQRGPPRESAAGQHARRSAVLVPLYEHDDATWVVLTRRSPRLRSHSHQVAFPGGLVDPTDADSWATALREAYEEVDLGPSLPRRIGDLDSFVTGGSNTYVTPLVAELPGRPDLKANAAEVEHILHVQLAELLLPEVFREELWSLDGQRPRPVTFFELQGDTVWGATAAMIRQLLAIATGTDDSLTM